MESSLLFSIITFKTSLTETKLQADLYPCAPPRKMRSSTLFSGTCTLASHIATPWLSPLNSACAWAWLGSFPFRVFQLLFNGSHSITTICFPTQGLASNCEWNQKEEAEDEEAKPFVTAFFVVPLGTETGQGFLVNYMLEGREKTLRYRFSKNDSQSIGQEGAVCLAKDAKEGKGTYQEQASQRT